MNGGLGKLRVRLKGRRVERGDGVEFVGVPPRNIIFTLFYAHQNLFTTTRILSSKGLPPNKDPTTPSPLHASTFRRINKIKTQT